MSAGEVWFFDAAETKNRLHIQRNRFFSMPRRCATAFDQVGRAADHSNSMMA
ncbi:MAG TPA: hypothetical protein PKA43_01605 [Candidatus Competibacter phosphatis]|nr:hypothetical protein [Candidatus Competibacter phosphatis]